MSADRPLHIVAPIYTYAPSVGGAQRLVASILEPLVARGHRATVITFNAANLPDLRRRGGAGLPASDVVNGVSIARVMPEGGMAGRVLEAWATHRMGGRLVKRLSGVDVPYWGSWPQALGMLRPLLAEPADVLLSVGWFARHVPLVHLVARWRGCPVVGLPLMHLSQPSAHWPRQRWLARTATRVVAMTEPEAVHLRGLGARQVDVIGGGVDSSWGRDASGAAWRAQLGIDPGTPVVGFVGRQVANKGATVLIDAMRRVWEVRPDALLLLAGRSRNRDAATTARLEALTPLERARVILVDDFADADTAELLAACTVIALPSVDESFGLVYLEAWMAKRPVIGADIPSSRSLIHAGHDGLLVGPHDVEGLAAALLRFMHDPGLAAAFGERGYRKVLEHFTLEAQRARWIALIEAVATPVG